ncbi:ABC transporter ATP-binding protein [Candidatus Woesearchaeota archaeon]|nr:MAG: ABC transporter ATP-binding protein [Candidatus Woesearchaeota archaeon]
MSGKKDAQKKPEKRVVAEVSGLSQSFGYVEVLHNITFRIEEGDFLGIIGPNGSGKTTLLKTILGLYPLKKGRIKLFGKPLRSFSDWHLIGYVPQKATDFDRNFPATVKEIVATGLVSRKGFPRFISGGDFSLVDEKLELVGMLGFKDRQIGKLSGGQQQRVFIARALVSEPKVLLLDEPTAGVDQESQFAFYKLLEELNKKGITIVLVSHDIGTITRYVNKVACLAKTLVFHGTHEEFCRSEVAQQFLTQEQHLLCHTHFED